MPSTLTGRAIGSYQIQAKPVSSARLYDRTSGSSLENEKRKKDSFAEILKDHVRKHAND